MAIDDLITGVPISIGYEHHEVHAGNHYNIQYSVASIGALAAPVDTMTLTWKTPNNGKEMHVIVNGIAAAAARFRFIEGKGTGGASPAGTVQSYNSNRGSSRTSGILDAAGANVTKASYGATLFTGTGSKVLVDEYIGAQGRGNSFTGGEARGTQEWILAANTYYQLSIFLNAATPGSIQMSWYEHISKT